MALQKEPANRFTSGSDSGTAHAGFHQLKGSGTASTGRSSSTFCGGCPSFTTSHSRRFASSFVKASGGNTRPLTKCVREGTADGPFYVIVTGRSRVEVTAKPWVRSARVTVLARTGMSPRAQHGRIFVRRRRSRSCSELPPCSSRCPPSASCVSTRSSLREPDRRMQGANSPAE